MARCRAVRDIGLRAACAGGFNDFLRDRTTFARNGSQAAVRVADAIILSDDSASIVQLAADARYSGSQRDSLRFRARPQAHAAPYFLDTGLLPAFGSTLAAAEGRVGRGPISVASEGLADWVAQPGRTTRFAAAYTAVSWFPRGEHRRYDISSGTLGDVDMQGHANTFEVAGEYSWTNLRTSAVDGGLLDEGMVALSWYRARGLRAEINAGVARLDRRGIVSQTPIVLARCQWNVH